MQPSSSQSVNSVPNWGNNHRSQSGRTADPLAFFDLIMDSARSSLGQGANSFGPTPSATSTSTTPSRSNETTAGKSAWQDDQRGEPAPASVASSPAARPMTESSDADHEEVESQATADVVELSDDQAAEGIPREEADQAAEETAAAAGQSQQRLGAPDTLASSTAEDAEATEEASVSKAKSTLSSESKATQPVDTDKPLDTSAEGASAEAQATVSDAAEAEATAAKLTAQEEETGSEENEEVALETESQEATAEIQEESVERDIEATQDSSEEQAAEANAEEEVATVEQESQDDSAKNNKEASRSHQAAKVEAKVEAAADVTGSPIPDPAQAAPEVAEAVAANSAATSVQNSSSGESNIATNNNPNNIAGLLQRGLQQGTLQKSTEGKATPQLDPKQQIRLINRVARAVETTPPGQSIKIRLNPSELGQLKVEIKVEQGNMIAKIEAENPATRQVLLQHLPQLRERLAESNINVQQFDVDVMGQHESTDGGTSNLGDQQADGGSSSGGSRQWGASHSGDDEVTAPRAEQVNKEAERDSRNLNVTI